MQSTANKQGDAGQSLDWDSLRQLQNSKMSHFQLALKDHEETLIAKKIMRIIPGKRLVIEAKWGNRQVAAKIFLDKGRGRQQALREIKGVKNLIEAGILTPPLLFQGEGTDKRIFVLIFEFMDEALSLDEIWKLKNNLIEISPLMQAVTLELATQHVMGVTQHDLHFQNFLIRKKSIYTLDGSEVTVTGKPLSKKDSLDNLSLFFSQMGVGTENLQERLFEIYAKSRGFLVKDQDLQYLKSSMQKCLDLRKKHYQKKIFRTCSAFVRQDSLTQVTIYDRQYETETFMQVLKNPEIYLNEENADILKDGRSTTVFDTEVDRKHVVVKRYNMKNVFHHLRRGFRPTRAAKNWRYGHTLRLLGVSTPKPIACVEKQIFGFKGISYLFLEYAEGMPAEAFFKNPAIDDYLAMSVAQEMILLIENLAKLQITHGDLKISNWIIANQKPILLDLDGMSEHQTRLGLKRALQEDMQRFMRNWENEPRIAKMFELLMIEMYQRMKIKA